MSDSIIDAVSPVLIYVGVIGWLPAIFIAWCVALCRASTAEERERQRRLTLPIAEQEELAEDDRIAYDDMIRKTYPLRAQNNGWYPFDK